MAEEVNGVVIGDGAPVGEVDAGIGLGQGEDGTISGARLGSRLAEVLVEGWQKGRQDGIGLGGIAGTSAAQGLDQAVLKGLEEAFDPSLGLRRVGGDEADAQLI